MRLTVLSVPTKDAALVFLDDAECIEKHNLGEARSVYC